MKLAVEGGREYPEKHLDTVCLQRFDKLPYHEFAPDLFRMFRPFKVHIKVEFDVRRENTILCHTVVLMHKVTAENKK